MSWRAIFKNNEILNEYDELGRERLFGEVLKRLPDLESLSIILGDKIYSVRMNDGLFSILTNNESHKFFVLDPEVYNKTTLENIRPIYFSRETVTFTLEGVKTGFKVNFVALGFQANYEGKNIKRYLAIFDDGNFVVKDN